MNAFGTPNARHQLDICGWGRAFATRYTYGVGSVGTGGGGAMPDIANSGCLILWGYNPSYHPPHPRDRRGRGAEARHAADRRRSAPRRPRQQGRSLAAGAARHRRRARARHRQSDDRARLVRPRLHPRLEQRAASGARRYRPAADRSATSRRTAMPRRIFAWDTAAARLVPYDTADRPLRRRQREPRAGGRIPHRHAAGRGGLPPGLRALRAALPALSAGGGRGDLLDSARPGRGSRAADLARAPGLLLRLERPRAARQRHADGARHVAALCADRLLRRARRQCAVPGAARRADHRRGSAGGEADGADAGPRRAPARAGALGQRHHPRSLPGHPGGETIPGPRPDRLRRQHAAGPRRRRARAQGARGAGVLRPRRSVHDPDRRTRRRGAAGRLRPSSARR